MSVRTLSGLYGSLEIIVNGGGGEATIPDNLTCVTLTASGNITGNSIVSNDSIEGVSLLSASTITGQTFSCLAATASTSTTTGCAVFIGGVGVGGKITADTLHTNGPVENGGFDFILGNSDQVSRGNTGMSRAMVKLSGSLCINYSNDFYSTIIDSPLTILYTTTAQAIICDSITSTANSSLGKITLSNTTESTNTSTGSFITPGGIASAKNIVSGGNVNCQGLLVKNTQWTSSSNDVIIEANSSSISLRPTIGSSNAVMTNNTTNFFVNNSAATAILNIDKSTEITTIKKVTISDTTASTSSSTGGLVSSAGIAISNTTQATSSTNGGSFSTAGGFAVAKNAYVGGNLVTTGSITGSTFILTGNSGVFTPSINSDTTVTYTLRAGTWLRIDKMVFITLNITTTTNLAVSPSIVLTISNLPFNPALAQFNLGLYNQFTAYLDNYDLPVSTDYVVGIQTPGYNSLSFFGCRSGLAPLPLYAPTTSGSRTIRMTFSYQTD